MQCLNCLPFEYDRNKCSYCNNCYGNYNATCVKNRFIKVLHFKSRHKCHDLVKNFVSSNYGETWLIREKRTFRT